MDHTAETLIAAAESAYALVESSPREAAAEARRIMGEAARAREPEAQAAALHALGFAQYQLADAEALRTLRRAIRVAERAGHPTRAAFARRLLAGIYADRGNVRDALREIDRACAGLQGSDLARAQTVRLAVLATLGHSDIDLSFTHVALRRLEREVDQTWQARLLHNRGLVRWNRGDPRAAADFVRSRELFDALGARVTAAAVDLLLVRVALSQDDVVEAIRRLDGIDTTDLPDRLVALVDGHRGRVLLAARLFDEAAEPLRNAEMILVGAGTDGTALEERLEITRLLLAAGEHEDARRGALRIGRSTAIRGNQLLGARATILAIAAAARGGTAGPSDVRVARQAIRVLDKHAPPAERMRARLVLARVALVAGQPSRADAALGEVKSSHVQLPVIDRIDRFAVDAMLYESRGDLTRGRRALRNGLRQLDAHRSTLGSVELRAAASGAGVELSLRGLRMAARSGNAREMLSWAEALRSNSLRLPALKPTRDATLSARQVELRRVTTRIREADARGLPRQRLARRQTELEGEIRARTRAIQGNGGLSTSGSSLRSAQQSLGDRVLVEYVELDGRMHALTLTRAKLRLHELGEAAHGQELDWLRFALRRLARGGLDAPARGAALANAGAAAAALDRQLVEPLREAIGEAPLVLVPTGALHALPWSGLPSLRGRPIVVAPSLETWRELDARTRRRGKHAAFIAGPGLRHATAEIRGLGPLWPDATVLTGKRATVDATLAALDGAALAHFACHGRFRSDSPLFSSLELYDGPLNALDLQRLGRAPDIVVLSACDVALSERHPGDELLGLSAALLASGTRTIIASVVPVPDAAARRLMLDFHRRLVGGASPAAALAATQAGLRADQSALAGFLCLGSG